MRSRPRQPIIISILNKFITLLRYSITRFCTSQYLLHVQVNRSAMTLLTQYYVMGGFLLTHRTHLFTYHLDKREDLEP